MQRHKLSIGPAGVGALLEQVVELPLVIGRRKTVGEPVEEVFPGRIESGVTRSIRVGHAKDSSASVLRMQSRSEWRIRRSRSERAFGAIFAAAAISAMLAFGS